MAQDNGANIGTEDPRVIFSFIKSSGFRVIHVDGAIGGVTPRGYIHCALYSERHAIPRQAEAAVQPDGSLGPLRVTDAREGIVREIEVDLILDKDMASQLHAWLGRQIERLQELEQAMKVEAKK